MKITFHKFLLFLISSVMMICLFLPSSVQANSAVDGFNPAPNGNVLVVELQPDGKILVGGAFSYITGQPLASLVRLNPDGTLDTLFTTPEINDFVETIALQDDGKILIGGPFTTVGGEPHMHIARLNSDGSLDSSFAASINEFGDLYTIAVQSDGKIILGGLFGKVNDINRVNLARIDSTGALDTTFTAQTSNSGSVQTIELQSNGKILVGGSFDNLAGSTKDYFGRLNKDGSFDSSCTGTVAGTVDAIDIQADGRIIIAGLVSNVDGVPRTNIARLNTNCSLDVDFNPVIGTTTKRVFSTIVQADGKILIGGAFSYVNGVERSKLARLNTDGSTDMLFNPGPDGYVYTIAVQQNGSVLVGGEFSSLAEEPRSRLGRLYPDGSLDETLSTGADGYVAAIALQPNGKILIGGHFTFLDSSPNSKVGRLNPDGGLDVDFIDPNILGTGIVTVNTIAVQPDGKILIGGNFSSIGGETHYRLGRLNSDGTVDSTFTVTPNDEVYAIALQPDGKIIIAGRFTYVNSTARDFIARLNPDGSLDTSFNANAGGFIDTLAILPDGSIFIGGNFITIGGVSRSRIAKLNANGSLDTSFITPGANARVYTLVVQPDGKILAGGDFTSLAGATRNYIGRLNADGSVDEDFNPSPNGSVFTLALQSDGKILVGGTFNIITGTSCSKIVRLTAKGELDEKFNGGADDSVYAITVQEDGKTLVGGGFTTLGGQPRSRIGRFSNSTPALQSFRQNEEGTAIQWLRSGTNPEFAYTTFESSTDGINFSPLGAGERIENGWELTDLSLPFSQNLYIKSRGYLSSGMRLGSGSPIESVWNVFLAPPPLYLHLPLILR